MKESFSILTSSYPLKIFRSFPVSTRQRLERAKKQTPNYVLLFVTRLWLAIDLLVGQAVMRDRQCEMRKLEKSRYSVPEAVLLHFAYYFD